MIEEVGPMQPSPKNQTVRRRSLRNILPPRPLRVHAGGVFSEKKGRKERENSGGGGSAQSRNCHAFGFYPPGGATGGVSEENGNTRLLLLCTCPHARLLLALISPPPVTLRHMWARRRDAAGRSNKMLIRAARFGPFPRKVTQSSPNLDCELSHSPAKL